MSQDTKTFQTQDLNLSAVLIAKDFSLADIVKVDGGKSTFVFSMNEGIELAIQAYWNNELLINPQALFHALRVLKNRLYSNY